VVLLPAIMALLGLIVAGGRIWLTRAAVNEAAYSGARAASIERSAGAGAAAGRRAAIAELDNRHLPCRNRSVRTDVSGFATPVGKPAQVHTSVRCRVTFGDLLLPGMPGSITLRSKAAAALDTYRGRG
jgi:Flp pilus assembly protein TadG